MLQLMHVLVRRNLYSPNCRASSRDSSSTLLARGVNGISTATNPLPRPATGTFELTESQKRTDAGAEKLFSSEDSKAELHKLLDASALQCRGVESHR